MTSIDYQNENNQFPEQVTDVENVSSSFDQSADKENVLIDDLNDDSLQSFIRNEENEIPDHNEQLDHDNYDEEEANDLKDNNIDELFEKFLSSSSLNRIKLIFYKLIAFDPELATTYHSNDSYNFTYFSSKIQYLLSSHWKAQRIFHAINTRAKQKVYFEKRSTNRIASNVKSLVIGAGPVGMRLAIELALEGSNVMVVEKREKLSRNNILHLWPFTIHDLKVLGAKTFFGKFCAGSIDHISIKQLQLILIKLSLLCGVRYHFGVEFAHLFPPSTQSVLTPLNENLDLFEPIHNYGWRAQYNPKRHLLSEYEFDVIVNASGKRSTLPGFEFTKFRGKIAIAITANFVNNHTLREGACPEISGVACIFHPQFFQKMYHRTGIDLENIVYYKGETHYFVMTAKRHSLLAKGVLKEDLDNEHFLSQSNINQQFLLSYAYEAAVAATDGALGFNLQFAKDHYGMPDVAMFDFTELYAAKHPMKIAVRNSKPLLMALVGDALRMPFWPLGTGAARGWLAAFDTAWSVRQFAQIKREMSMLNSDYCWKLIRHLISEREITYQLLAQTSSEKLSKNFDEYSIQPTTRYPNLNMKKIFDENEINSLILDLDKNEEAFDGIVRYSSSIHEYLPLILCQWIRWLCRNENETNLRIVENIFKFDSEKIKDDLNYCQEIMEGLTLIIQKIFPDDNKQITRTNVLDVVQSRLSISPPYQLLEEQYKELTPINSFILYLRKIYSILKRRKTDIMMEWFDDNRLKNKPDIRYLQKFYIQQQQQRFENMERDRLNSPSLNEINHQLMDNEKKFLTVRDTRRYGIRRKTANFIRPTFLLTNNTTEMTEKWKRNDEKNKRERKKDRRMEHRHLTVGINISDVAEAIKTSSKTDQLSHRPKQRNRSSSQINRISKLFQNNDNQFRYDNWRRKDEEEEEEEEEVNGEKRLKVDDLRNILVQKFSENSDQKTNYRQVDMDEEKGKYNLSTIRSDYDLFQIQQPLTIRPPLREHGQSSLSHSPNKLSTKNKAKILMQKLHEDKRIGIDNKFDLNQIMTEFKKGIHSPNTQTMNMEKKRHSSIHHYSDNEDDSILMKSRLVENSPFKHHDDFHQSQSSIDLHQEETNIIINDNQKERGKSFNEINYHLDDENRLKHYKRSIKKLTLLPTRNSYHTDSEYKKSKHHSLKLNQRKMRRKNIGTGCDRPDLLIEAESEVRESHPQIHDDFLFNEEKASKPLLNNIASSTNSETITRNTSHSSSNDNCTFRPSATSYSLNTHLKHCHICLKHVDVMERIVIKNQVILHLTCLSCELCAVGLNRYNYEFIEFNTSAPTTNFRFFCKYHIHPAIQQSLAQRLTIASCSDMKFLSDQIYRQPPEIPVAKRLAIQFSEETTNYDNESVKPSVSSPINHNVNDASFYDNEKDELKFSSFHSTSFNNIKSDDDDNDNDNDDDNGNEKKESSDDEYDRIYEKNFNISLNKKKSIEETELFPVRTSVDESVNDEDKVISGSMEKSNIDSIYQNSDTFDNEKSSNESSIDMKSLHSITTTNEMVKENIQQEIEPIEETIDSIIHNEQTKVRSESNSHPPIAKRLKNFLVKPESFDEGTVERQDRPVYFTKCQLTDSEIHYEPVKMMEKSSRRSESNKQNRRMNFNRVREMKSESKMKPKEKIRIKVTEENFNHFHQTNEKNKRICLICSKYVHLTERKRFFNSLIFHRRCIRCEECSREIDTFKFNMNSDYSLYFLPTHQSFEFTCNRHLINRTTTYVATNGVQRKISLSFIEDKS
ncbi:hypothetical protein SNEBB_006016 [Seison nebaliae]|nr:hypothetical protein SNEBB_006016 [Seison nebaliae]